MSLRDREVLDLLRDEPDLLAIADAVTDTQHASRPLRPFRAIAAVMLAAAAIFVLVLASPWDHGGGGGKGSVLDRALAAIDTRGPVVHLTTRIEFSDSKQKFPALVTESYYDKRRHLAHVITRSEGAVVADYTTSAIDDEFATFPGLLDQADFYRKALKSGQAKVVGKGEWQGRPVYWVELDRGGAFSFRIGVDRENYRPVVFRTLNPNGRLSGFQLAVLGFSYVSAKESDFQTDAPILVTGRVVGPNCRPVKARVAVSISPVEDTPRLTPDAAVADTGPGGTFTLRADPTKSPFRDALRRNTWLNFDVNAVSGAGARVSLVGFFGVSRFVKDGRWWEGEPAQPERPTPITIGLLKKSPGRHC
jgi:hypothetical protein